MKQIDFIGKKKIFFAISIAMVVITLLFSIFKGVELDIQYKGGTMITYSYTGEIDHSAFQSLVEETVGGRVFIQDSSDIATGSSNLVVSLASTDGLTSEEQATLSDAVESAYAENNLKTESISNVSATVGREFFIKSLIAVLFAAIVMVVYIGFRFKRISGWSAGVMAGIALIHDVIAAFAVFVIVGIPIDANFMAVVLTILGYSINDTIVIYDRVRENRRIYGTKLSTAELMNKSMNQSLKRTLITSLTTIMALAVVAVVTLLYNVTSIVSFVFPMIVGLISGTYSSICLVPSLWVMWQDHQASKAEKQEKKK